MTENGKRAHRKASTPPILLTLSPTQTRSIDPEACGLLILLARALLLRRAPRHRVSVNSDPIDTRASARSAAAAAHQVGKADFIDPAQVGVALPLAVDLFDNAPADVQPAPADVGESEFGYQPIPGVRLRVVAH